MNIQLKDVDNVVFNGVDISAVKFNDVLVWQKWETIEYTGGVPVTVTANGEPLLDYLISGNMSQSGVPSPSSIIMPQETGEKTANLFDYKTTYATYVQSDNTVVGSASEIYSIVNYFDASLVNQEITISAYTNNVYQSRVYILAKIGSETIESNAVFSGNSGTLRLTITPTATTDYWRLSYGTGGVQPITYSNFMLNPGSTALPYEPYGYKLPFISGSTTTNIYLSEPIRKIGDYTDVVESDGTVMRRIKKLVLTGTETATIATAITATNAFQVPTATEGYQREPFICSHMPVNASNTSANTHGYYGQRLTLCLSKSMGIETVADFKAWLASEYANGTPVCVWYVLANEQTGILNEPIRKIGDYADSINMEQAGVSIPTVEGENLIDVETTLKPSQIYLKYKGRSDS